MAALPLPAAILDDLIPGTSGNEVIQDGGLKRKGRHLAPPPQWDRKTLHRSWLTSFPAPPSWNQDAGATSNVWRTSELPWNPQKGIVLVQKRPVDIWSYFFYFSIEIKKKHLIVSLPQPLVEGVARLPLRGSWSVCTCQHHVPWNVVLTSASTYSTFLGFYVFIFLTVHYNSLELLYSTVS